MILRLGNYHDENSAVRNAMAARFEAFGLENTATGTWESPSVDQVQAAAQLAAALGELAALPNSVNGANADASLTHLWIYIDRVDLPADGPYDD